MRARKAVVFLLLTLAVPVAVPTASAALPELPVHLVVNVEIGENCKGSGDYDNGGPPSPPVGYDDEVPGVFVVVPNPKDPEDGRTGYIIAICIRP